MELQFDQALTRRAAPVASVHRFQQQSARRKASTVRAVSLHAAIVLASLIAASVTLVT